MRETYPQNLILCVQVRKKQFHAPGLKIHSVSANLALSSEKILLSSARSAALGKTLEPRGLPNTEDPSFLNPFLSPASMQPGHPIRASLCLWELLSLQWPIFVHVLTLSPAGSPSHTSSAHFSYGQADLSLGHSRPLIRAQKPVSGPRKGLISFDIIRNESSKMQPYLYSSL